MRTFRSFMRHKFTYRQSLIVIGASVLVGFAANQASKAAGLPPVAVTGVGIAALFGTLFPLLAVFYRRTHA